MLATINNDLNIILENLENILDKIWRICSYLQETEDEEQVLHSLLCVSERWSASLGPGVPRERDHEEQRGPRQLVHPALRPAGPGQQPRLQEGVWLHHVEQQQQWSLTG